MKAGATLLLFCMLGVPAHAAGPPKCPPGQAPERLKHGWTCAFGAKWPWGMRQIRPSDCPPGTNLTLVTPCGSPHCTASVGDPFQEWACLPPAPPCEPGFTAFGDAAQPSGWKCRKRFAERPNCPQGSAPLRDEYGWRCEAGLYWPSGFRLKASDCPPGTNYDYPMCLPPAPKCGAGFVASRDPRTPAGWRCFSRLPPQCPPGSGPVRGYNSGWSCRPGIYWPMGGDMKDSYCPPGTTLVQMHQRSACLPPAPRCPRGFDAAPDESAPSGWHCLRRPACPQGTVVQFNPGQSFECLPPNGGKCPSGTVWAGDCCGDCAPADRNTCLSTPGWKWTDAGCLLRNASQ
jgi:hypothetical protein